MKRLIRPVSLFICLLLCLSWLPTAARAENTTISSLNITYDASHVFPTTRLSGRVVTAALYEVMTTAMSYNVTGDDDFYVYGGPDNISDWTCLCYKVSDENSSWGSGYYGLASDYDLLTADREYYFRFDVYDNSSAGKRFPGAGVLPTVTVNGSPAAEVRYVDDHQIEVYQRVYLNETGSCAGPVTLTPMLAAVQKGTSATFTASAVGTNTAVTWSVIGNNSSGTKITSAGVLTVAASETAGTITVRASAKANHNVHRDAAVTVTDAPPYISGLSFVEAGLHCTVNDYCTLKVTVGGTDVPTVNWTVTGATDSDTYIYKEEDFPAERMAWMTLHIGSIERSKTLTVRATSTADPSKYAETTVTVDETAELLTDVDITYDAARLPLNSNHSGYDVSYALFECITCPKTNANTASDDFYVYGSPGNVTDWTSLCYKTDDESGSWSAGFNSLYSNVSLLTDDKEYYLRFDVYANHGLSFEAPENLNITVNGVPVDFIRPVQNNEIVVYIRVNLRAPVAILTQPKNYSGAAGSTASFSVVASGDELTYQWWVKDPGASSFSKSSVKTSKYSVTLKDANSGRQLYCVITDAHGNTATTKTVTMTIGTPLTITTQPKNYVGASGSTASFSVVASGDELTYQWWLKNPGGSSFSKSSVKIANYSATLTESNSGRQLYCVVTDKYGSSVTTDTVTMTLSTPLAITAQPMDYTGTTGSTASFSIVAEGDGLSYQWWVKNPGASSFTKSSIKKATYTVTLTADNSGRELYCVVKDERGNTVTTDTVVMVVAKPLRITTQPVDYVGAANSTASFTVKAEGNYLSYQWYVKDPGSGSFTKSSVKTNKYSVTLKTANSGRQLYCVVSDRFGGVVVSDTVTMTIATKPTITTQPTNVSVAVGGTATFKVTATGATSYQWYYRKSASDSWTAVSAASGKTSTYKLTTEARHNGYQYRCLVKNSAGSVYTNTVTLTVSSSKPTITSQPSNVSVAVGGTATFKVTATGATSYQWYYRTSSTGTWTAVAASSGKTASYSLTTAAKHNGYQYRCKVTNSVGSVYSNTVTLTVKPKITTQPTGKTVTAGTTVHFKVTAENATSYQWYYRTSSTGSWTEVSAASGKTADYSLTTAARHNGYQYRCKVMNATSYVYTSIVTLKVN
ncbi:MAG: immunoglobulin domain-containing protein [Oscillospiraceae bacterium]|nr:immunoglobulin domain-containing protein [Oscillospiraceae bacterium]